MRLYNVLPRESLFNWPDKSARNRQVEMYGQWVGGPGKGYRHIFVPVFVGTSEPDENGWGVEQSKAGLPKLVSNVDYSTGFIALLSPNRGDGHEVGRVLIEEAGTSDIEIIATGIGGSVERAIRFNEYLVIVREPTTFLILSTLPPVVTITFLVEEAFVTPLTTPDVSLLRDYVDLEDPRIARWKRRAPLPIGGK